jgi:hypothetical protein
MAKESATLTVAGGWSLADGWPLHALFRLAFTSAHVPMRKKLLIGVVALLLVLTATAYLLPRYVTVKHTAQILAPPEVVFPILSTPAEWPKWSPWNARDTAMSVTLSGPPTGVGATWSWQSASQGNGSMTFTLSIPSVKVEYLLSIEGMGPPSKGDFLIAPNAEGCVVAWTQVADMGNSPVGRWMGLLLRGWLRTDFEEGLARLSDYAQTQPPPPPIIGIEMPAEVP